MKSILRAVLCLFAAAAVTLSGSVAWCADKPITLRIGHVVTEDGGEHLGSLKLAELLDKKSNGMIKL
ncbi:MAG: hypothetical protein LBP61_05200, partial [Desulfovibrio sp.]|nr:hypothetical protein [Desulfovibrio sp.]